MKKNFLLLVIFCSLFFVIACGDNASEEIVKDNEVSKELSKEDKNENENEEPQEPVTITFMSDYPEDRLNEEWIDPLKEEFPHVTIEQVVVQSVNREGV